MSTNNSAFDIIENIENNQTLFEMNYLLEKYGLKDKISFNDFIGYYHLALEDISKSILSNADLDNEKYKKAIYEVRLFLYAWGLPVLAYKLPDNLLNEVKHYFSVVARDYSKDWEYSDEYLDSINHERIDYYINFRSLLVDKSKIPITERQLEVISIIWFHEPLTKIEAIKINYYSFDEKERTNNILRVQLNIIHLVSLHIEQLKELLELTKIAC